MRFDDYELRNTAEVILSVNPYAENETIEGLVERMKNMAYQYLLDGKSSFCGTLGFYLSAYKSPDGEIEVRSTVGSHMILEYLEKQA